MNQLLAVGQDDKVTRVRVGSVGRLVLAHQYCRNVSSDSTDSFIFTVDDPPLLLERFICLCVVRFCARHFYSPMLCRTKVRPRKLSKLQEIPSHQVAKRIKITQRQGREFRLSRENQQGSTRKQTKEFQRFPLHRTAKAVVSNPKIVRTCFFAFLGRFQTYKSPILTTLTSWENPYLPANLWLIHAVQGTQFQPFWSLHANPIQNQIVSGHDFCVGTL